MRPIDADTLKKRFGRKIRQLIHAMEYGKVLTNDNEASVKEFYEAVCEEIDNEPTINDWIPCSERMPEDDEDVLVSAHEMVYIAYHSEGYWYWDYGNIPERDVAAWKPKPEPYKEAEE